MAFGIDDAIAAGLKILDKFIPDPSEKAKAEGELRDALLKWDTAQTEVNKVEAASTNWFVAGWRPFIGWVCGAAFAYTFIAQPFALFILAAFGATVTAPALDMGSLMTVLLGMLGLGGLRSWEKTKGVSR